MEIFSLVSDFSSEIFVLILLGLSIVLKEFLIEILQISFQKILNLKLR